MRITLFCQGREIRGFLVEGHAHYDEAGRDILCAAVSVLAQNSVNALIAVAGVRRADIRRFWMDDRAPRLGILLGDMPRGKRRDAARAILLTFALGIKSLAGQMPYKPHIHIVMRRWNDD